MKRLLTLLAALAGAHTLSVQAHAAGYSFFEQSAAATGRASAVIATPTDPSAIFYNPAGLADLPGLNLYLGGTFVLPTGGYETRLVGGTGTVTFDRAVRGVFPPNLFLSYGKDQWAVGLGVFNAFGLGIDWPANFPGSARIDRVDLKTPTLQPTFSWRASKYFSLGVGVSISVASAELQRSLPLLQYPAGSVFLGADQAVGVGGNIGFQFAPRKDLRIGAHYRSAVKYTFNGKADFTFDPSVDPSIRASLPSDQTGSLDLTTPHVVGVGIAYDITKNFTIELDWAHYFWSVFDELRLKFGPPPAGGSPVSAVPPANCTPPGLPAGVTHICSPRSWMDTSQFRLGVEWRATPAFSLRGGYVFDLTPVPSTTIDPILPDANRHDFAVGFGYRFGKTWQIDFAYMAVYFVPRDAPERFIPEEAGPGRYTGLAHLFAINLGAHFF